MQLNTLTEKKAPILQKTSPLQKEALPQARALVLPNNDTPPKELSVQAKSRRLLPKPGVFKGKGKTKRENTCLTKEKGRVFKAAVWGGVFIFAFYLLTHPRISFTAVEGALTLCLKTLIPSLFPFMIAGELLILSGFPDTMEKLTGKIFHRVFGLNGKGASAFVIGAFCGFPVGAKTAVSLYLSGDINKEDAECLSGISNNAGLGFLISGVGAGIWGSSTLGVLIYVSGILSSVITGALLFGVPKRTEITVSALRYKTRDEKKFLLSGAVSEAVSSASLSILKVIGFVVFFEVMLSGLSEALTSVGANAITVSVVCAFTEISSGVKALHLLTLLPSPLWKAAAKILTFTFSAFGGLSVYMQYCAFACPAGLKTGAYLKSKLTQAAVCTLIGATLVFFGII